MSSKNIKIFDETGCLSEHALVEYAHGRLDIHLKKQVEIHINECDFCRDALEGISLMKSKESSRAAIAELNERIINHGKPERVGGKVIVMNYWRIAAAVTLFIVLGGGVLFVALNPGFKNEVARNKAEEKAKILAENKQQEMQKPDEQDLDSSMPELAPPAPTQESGLPVMLTDQSLTEELAEMDVAEASGDGTVTEGKMAEDLSGNNISTTTATGGISNAAPSYYDPQGWSAAQTPGNYRDSVFTFNSDKYVSDDIAGTKNLETPSLAEVTVESSTSKTKSNDKKAQKQAYEKADNNAPEVADDRGRAEQTISKVEEAQQEFAVLTTAEQMPYYPGGDIALLKYIRDNISYPQAAKEQAISGTVYISYVVSVTGKVTKVKVSRGVSKELDKEAVRVISSLKDYNPGMQGGKAVPVQMIIPVKFTLQ